MKISRFVYSLATVLFGLGILFVSISRVGVKIAAQDNAEDQVRNNPIEVTTVKSDGTKETSTYKIPEIGTLPSSPFYGFKKIRDYLWLVFAQGNMNKAKVAFLLADKKIAETDKLISNDNSKLALEASSEAIDKLKYADQLISKETEQLNEAKQVKFSIYKAGLAYKQIIKRMEGQFEIDRDKLNKIISDLEEFNEKTEEEQKNMENQ